MAESHQTNIKQIAICGATGGCFDLLDLLLNINATQEARGRTAPYHIAGFFDDRFEAGTRIGGYPVLGGFNAIAQFPTLRLTTAIGSEKNYFKRGKIIASIAEPDRWETLVHPTASLSSFCEIGQGTVIHAFAKIAANVRVGRNVLILPHAVINHDCAVGEFTIINSGANFSGNVRLGASCYIGGGVCIKNDVSVGDGALVGLGSVVTRDIDSHTVNLGVPSKSKGKVNESAA